MGLAYMSNSENTRSVTLRTRIDVLLRNPVVMHVLIVLSSFEISAASILLTRGTGDVAAVWPVNAILLVLVLKWQKSRWPSLFACLALGNFAANINVGDPPLLSLVLTTANCLEVLIVALILSRTSRIDVTRQSGILKLSFASLVACVISTSIALAGLALTGSYLPLLNSLLWFFADFLGLMLFTPLIWAAIARDDREGSRVSMMSLLELALVVVVTLGVFAQSTYPRRQHVHGLVARRVGCRTAATDTPAAQFQAAYHAALRSGKSAACEGGTGRADLAGRPLDADTLNGRGLLVSRSLPHSWGRP